MRHNGRKLDPHHRRQRAGRYSPDVLHAMLLDDLVHHRPLGGPMERGTVFTVEACARVAKHRRCSVDDYFEALLAEGASITGTTDLPLA